MLDVNIVIPVWENFFWQHAVGVCSQVGANSCLGACVPIGFGRHQYSDQQANSCWFVLFIVYSVTQIIKFLYSLKAPYMDRTLHTDLAGFKNIRDIKKVL